MAKKEKPPATPDDLVRAGAGAYRSGDGRFDVHKSDQRWFLVDNEQANEFGQQLIHGPFETLEDVRAAIPGARDIKPLLRGPRKPAKTPGARPGSPKKAAPRKPPTPLSWIDRLPAQEAAEVRRLVGALDAAGVTNAASVVKRDRDSEDFAIAAEELIARMLAGVKGDDVRKAVRRAAEILTDEGGATARPLPRWELVETPRDADQAPRRVRVRIGS
ncbi:MAG: hypothetical protein QOJ81_512 [Chloroflexota bacterium]|jgi:hypothetical protein|nr:hypothetical protein [Chloroflexota bacterium]